MFYNNSVIKAAPVFTADNSKILKIHLTVSSLFPCSLLILDYNSFSFSFNVAGLNILEYYKSLL